MLGKKCQIFRSNETTPIPNATLRAFSRYQTPKGHLNAQNQATKKVRWCKHRFE
ncbi:hypothetical protein C1H46_005104 [Malus baccata]|uniref:Uncharacterized protein n=1 Tax=Malus baccata TaxID=106549 RepID=A0A540NDQ5_MALBA|nr:hypothetical protein C1H46_005104 [Malus baccata]